VGQFQDGIYNSKGRSEEIIGRALRGRRHEAQILTKDSLKI